MNFQRLSHWLLLFFLGSAIGCGVYAVVNDVQRSRIVHQLDYEEGNILNTAVLINQGMTPYPDLHAWPVVINPYGPLPYYLTAGIVHFFGPRFAPPRALIIAAAMVCALLTGLLIVHFTGSPLVGACFGFLLLSQRLVESWMPVLRVDFLALTLALLGLYLFARFPRRWPLAATLFAFAIFTKFSFLAAPSACFVSLLVQRQWRRAFYFAALMCAVVAALFGSAILATHGAFAYDVFLTEGSPMAWIHLHMFFRPLFGSNPVLIILCVAALAWACKTRQFVIPVLYVIFTLLESLTSAKVGSNSNHLLELNAALCILAGWFVCQMLQRGSALAVAVSLAGAAIGIWMLLLLPYVPSSRPVTGCTEIYNAIAHTPSDRILSEDSGLLVVNRKTVWVSGTFAYALLANSGKSPDTELQQRVRDRWFDYVVLDDDWQQRSTRWSDAVRQRIGENYTLVGRFPCRDARYVYAPIGKP